MNIHTNHLIQLHLPEVENNPCNDNNQQNPLWHCYVIKSSEISTDDYIAFIFIKYEKEYNTIYFAQYGVKASSDRIPMIELLQYVPNHFPGQHMIGVGHRINQDVAQFFY